MLKKKRMPKGLIPRFTAGSFMKKLYYVEDIPAGI